MGMDNTSAAPFPAAWAAVVFESHEADRGCTGCGPPRFTTAFSSALRPTREANEDVACDADDDEEEEDDDVAAAAAAVCFFLRPFVAVFADDADDAGAAGCAVVASVESAAGKGASRPVARVVEDDDVRPLHDEEGPLHCSNQEAKGRGGRGGGFFRE